MGNGKSSEELQETVQQATRGGSPWKPVESCSELVRLGCGCVNQPPLAAHLHTPHTSTVSCSEKNIIRASEPRYDGRGEVVSLVAAVAPLMQATYGVITVPPNALWLVRCFTSWRA
jgi:hypothetical protein